MFKCPQIGSLIVIENVPKTNKTLSGREVGTVIYMSELLVTVQGVTTGPEKYYKQDGSAFRKGVRYHLTDLSPAQVDRDNEELYQKQRKGFIK